MKARPLKTCHSSASTTIKDVNIKDMNAVLL